MLPPLLIPLLLLLAGGAVAGVRAKPSVKLRTQTLDINPTYSIFSARPPAATPQYLYPAAAATAQAAAQQLPPADGPASLQSSPLWNHAANHSLYLISFDSTYQRTALFHLLASFPTSSVASYIPDNTWLVVAGADAAAAAAALQGIQVLEYLPQYKVALEWAPILDLLSPSGPSSRRRARTRRLLLSTWSGGSPTGTALDHLQLQQPPGMAPHAAVWVSFPSAGAQAPAGAQMPAAAAQDWAPPLQALLVGSGAGCRPLLSPSARGLQVSVCPGDLQAAVGWLAQQPLAHFVAPVMRASTSNIYAGIIAQVAGLPDDARSQPLHPVYTPFWRMGLQGEGQVIGIADTGLYLDSCFMFDRNVPLTAASLVRDNVTGVNVLRPANHRKLVQYYAYANMVDENGHGTHVSGTAAGAPLLLAAAANASGLATNPLDAQGAAPAAKIAFFDMYDGVSLLPPPDLVDGLFQVQYNAGVRIQSDSWGYAYTFAYTDSSSQVDLFTWRNLDFLPIFAVGNYAANASNAQYQSGIDAWGLRAAGTITAPATAKNSIGVGSVNNYLPPSDTAAPQLTFRVSDQATGDLLKALSVIATTSLDYRSHAALLGKVFNVTVAAPFQACGPLMNAAGAVNGTVLIVGRGGCTFSDKAISAWAAGAAAVLVVSNDTQKLQPGGNPTQVKIPMAAVPLDLGSSILALIGVAIPRFSSITTSTVLRPQGAEAVGLSFTVEYAAVELNASVYDDVPDFSGYGPTSDGRIKPDLVAAGSSLLSALATGLPSVGAMDQCGTVRQQGTSMSTPLVAGAAALVREYFLKGFYPSGAPRKMDRYAAPSGMLIKAVLLAGAAAVTGRSQLLLSAPALAAHAPLAGSPLAQRFAGFGRLDLTHALPLQGNLYGPTWNLQVVDMVPIQESDVHSYFVTSTGGSVTVLLVWYDYPADVNARACIVNDLDLQVTAQTQAAAAASGWNASAPSAGAAPSTFCGNAAPGAPGAPDRVNTVERVVIGDVQVNATVNITVIAHSIQSTFLDPARQQRYALAVLGNLKGVMRSPYNPASRQG